MFKLSTRKLQRINTSFYLSLPITWVLDQGLHKNCEIEVYLTDDKKILLVPVIEESK